MASKNTIQDSSLEQEGEEAVGIKLRNVRKEYNSGSVVAVNDIDLDIEQGELLVLLGPSGCGKTTTLRMIAGLELVTEGEIWIQGENVTDVDPQNRGLSMVFQNYALYPHKSVRSNLLFPLKKMDLDEVERNERVQEVAELLEIEEHLEKKPKQLSGGQRQRVAVGRTIVREPKVFLMDEPLSNLDAKLRVQARADIRELQVQLGTTTVYVTHDQEEAMSIADRIAIMNRGEVEQVGTPQEVYLNPVNEFVAGFLGEPSMNFLDASVSNSGLAIFSDELLLSDTDVDPEINRIGVRPEDIYLHETLREDHPDISRLSDPIECKIDFREPLGHTNELTLRKGNQEIRALVENCPAWVSEDTTVDVVFDLDRIRKFDADGKAIDRKDQINIKQE